MKISADQIYSRIPTGLFYGEQYIKNSNKYLLLIFDSLYMRKGFDGKIGTSINNIVLDCGLKPNRNKGGINEIVRDTLKILEEIKYIEKVSVKSKSLPNELIMFNLKIDLSKSFIDMKRFEKDKIMMYRETKVDKHKLLNLYMYLKSRMNRKRKGETVDKDGGLPETCFPTYETISSDLGISGTTLTKHIKLLVNLDMIRISRAGKWYNPKDINISERSKIKESGYIYTLYTEKEEIYRNNLKEAVKNQRVAYENMGRVFI